MEKLLISSLPGSLLTVNPCSRRHICGFLRTLQGTFLANEKALDLFLPRVFCRKSSSIPYLERLQMWNGIPPTHSTGDLQHPHCVQPWTSLWRPDVEARPDVSEDETTPCRGQVSHRITNTKLLTQILCTGATEQ